jgi:outer membrane murein-binding lipoprotein Lpp
MSRSKGLTLILFVAIAMLFVPASALASSTILVGAPEAQGFFFYGMCCPNEHNISVAAQFTSYSGSSGLSLSPGQIASLTAKLNNVLASIQTGQTKPATNQLQAFVNSVESSLKTAKMDAATANALIAAVNAIIALL